MMSFLKDIKEIVLENDKRKAFNLILKLKNGTEDKTISTDWYVSELRIIKKIILEPQILLMENLK